LCISADNCAGWLGESSFPSDPANLQGFVIGYQYLGNTASTRFNLGRTATHEFGHFFNLIHIWADDNGCTRSDEVADTPNQGRANLNTPTFPLTDACTTTPPGVMFMNYMDYTDDRAMFMFTQGQVDRMVATLYTTQAGLLSSDALIPPPTTSAADLFIQDTPEDIGNEPNNESTDFYISPDIWLRNTNDGVMNQEHINPVYAAGGSSYVYVRIRNRGCAPSTNATVKLYWAKASTGLGWPDPWAGTTSFSGALMGNMIGSQPSGIIAGGSSTILAFPWPLPNPSDYSSFGADKAHFCLLARIETPTVAETSSLIGNVKNNNNIAWKNIEIASTGGGREAVTLMANYNKDSKACSIQFQTPPQEESVFNYGSVSVKLPADVFKIWQSSGSLGKNIAAQQDNTIQLLEPNATIENLPLSYKQFVPIKISFNEGEKRRFGPHVYFLDVKQYSPSIKASNLVGGQRVILKSFNKNTGK
jgi:Pregnancy-associated plasma protein-A